MTSESSSFKRLRLRQDGRVCTVELNLPDTRNPLGFAMAGEIFSAMAAADADPETRVIILGAVGPSFSGGHDLSAAGLEEYMAECATPEDLWSAEEKHFFHKIGLDIWNLDTPTIARVQGAVVLGAFPLANACDLIVAAEDAYFWTPGTRMYGGGAEMFMEPWVMDPRRAKEFLFTGEKMNAAEAWRVGMVNRVVPRDELDDATMALAQHIAKNPALGLKLAKRAVNKTMEYQGFRQALEYNFLLHVFGHATNAFQENMWKPLIEKVKAEGLPAYLAQRDKAFDQTRSEPASAASGERAER